MWAVFDADGNLIIKKSVKDNIKEWYQKSSEVIKAVENSPIIDHEYKNNIAVTKYENGVKVYVTVNIVFHDKDLTNVSDYLVKLDSIGVDAIIVSDVVSPIT